MTAHPILLTRPDAAALRFSQQLRAAGIKGEILASPLQHIRFLPHQFQPAAVQGVIFSSKNAVQAVAGCDLPAWCVGDATADAAKAKGWRAVSAQGDADALVDLLMQEAIKGPLIHLRGQHTRGDIARRLNAGGLNVSEEIVYAQEALPLSDAAKRLLNRENPVVVPLFSPRAAQQFVDQRPFNAPLRLVAISPTVAQMLGPLGNARVLIAEAPDGPAMIAAIKRSCNAE